MEHPEYKSTLALEILATSLATRLTLDELEWLWPELAQRTEQKRRQAGGEAPVLAGYQDGWDLERRHDA